MLPTVVTLVFRCDPPRDGRFAYPAVNVSSSQTLNATIRASPTPEVTASCRSRPAALITCPGRESGHGHRRHRAGGVRSRRRGEKPGHIALHTDHCPKEKLDSFMRPLVKVSQERVAHGEQPLYMWDGSAPELKENLNIAHELLLACAKAGVVMEMEIGVVGDEEDGVVGEVSEELYSTVEDAILTADILGTGENGRYLLAATFGNVHGAYKPGHVKLRPSVLKQIQAAVGATVGKEKPFALVFHGGSGSTLQEIRETLDYGVVTMNIDTDTQYAFTPMVAGHMFGNYDGVLKVDGEVGNKKAYDPRSWGKAAENGMTARVVEAARICGRLVRPQSTN